MVAILSRPQCVKILPAKWQPVWSGLNICSLKLLWLYFDFISLYKLKKNKKTLWPLFWYQMGLRHLQLLYWLVYDEYGHLCYLKELIFLVWLTDISIHWPLGDMVDILKVQPPNTTLIARFMGPTWGPSGADRTQVGPMLAPWTLLSGNSLVCFSILPPSGEQSEQGILAHKSEQPTAGCIAIFHKHCCYIKLGGIITKLNL